MDKVTKVLETALTAYLLFAALDILLEERLSLFFDGELKKLRNRMELMRQYDHDKPFVIFEALMILEEQNDLDSS
jgi:hypothetical protein